jgi:hypothetical protein
VSGNGSIAKDPDQSTYDYGTVVELTATPGTGWHFVEWQGDLSASANPSNITMDGDKDVTANFEIDTFAVKASAPGGFGKVSPAMQSVDYGGKAAIDISPDPGYRIASITDNGAAKTVNDPYTINNVREDHNVVVTFEPIPDPVTTAFYFAEGYTGAGFQEYLCLGQPADAPLDVTVTYMFKDGGTRTETYTVPAQSRLTIDVNGVVGAGQEVSLECRAASPFIAERPMYFDYTGAGEHWTGGHDVVGASYPAQAWYFAEGYTGAGFDEYICVLNPTGEPAALTFRFQTQEVGEKVVGDRSVPAHSRGSFRVNDLLEGGAYSTSLKLESSQPVVAERPMYFDYTGMGNHAWSGGHCVMGTPELATEYYFAEGTTRSGFEEWLCIQNPGGTDINVHATYMLETGETVEKDHPVPGNKRSTVYVPEQVGEGHDVSVRLTCASPFLAERPMYFDYAGMGGWSWSGGHCVMGATSTAATWFFAEGYTGDGFEEWLCIQNPNGSAANVTITYYPEGGGEPIVKTQPPIAANSRYTVYVNGVDNAGPGRSISSEVVSDQPVIVERPMYFNYAGWCAGGHDVLGFTP